MKLDEFLTCSCGTNAKKEGFAGEYSESGYKCVECVRKLNKSVVESWRMAIEERDE